MKFVLASHNKGKLKEMAAILGELGIEVASLPEGAPEPEENGATFEENARIKAKAAADFTGLPALVHGRTTAVCAWTRSAARRASALPATARERMRTAMRSC